LRRFDIYLVNLDPTVGHEIKKTRPAVIISPDEMNRNISTIIVAPMTTKSRSYPTRIPITFQQKEGQIILDQIRTIDKARLVKKIGKVNKATSNKILFLLIEMFSP
jgi:mRNA interferase MazF